jgi:bacillithiol system protein YtxJ
MSKYKKISNYAQWQQLLETSEKETVIILKHSSSCSISRGVFSRIDDGLQSGAIHQDVFYMVVQENPDLKLQIALETNIEHASPQIIILKNKKSIYHTSHNAIHVASMIPFL